MSKYAENTEEWLKGRIRRHISEVIRLSVPAVMMRLGIMMLGIVDTAMVGHYATEHLAWLNLANQSVIMFVMVVSMGLLQGVLVMTAAALGQKTMKAVAGCGDVLSCSLFVLAFLCWPFVILLIFG